MYILPVKLVMKNLAILLGATLVVAAIFRKPLTKLAVDAADAGKKERDLDRLAREFGDLYRD